MLVLCGQIFTRRLWFWEMLAIPINDKETKAQPFIQAAIGKQSSSQRIESAAATHSAGTVL